MRHPVTWALTNVCWRITLPHPLQRTSFKSPFCVSISKLANTILKFKIICIYIYTFKSLINQINQFYSLQQIFFVNFWISCNNMLINFPCWNNLFDDSIRNTVDKKKIKSTSSMGRKDTCRNSSVPFRITTIYRVLFR